MENSYVNANTLGDIDGAKVGIDISTKEDFVATNGVLIGASTTGMGRAGDVVIYTDSMEVKDSQISSLTLGQGDAGSLNVTAKNILIDVGTNPGFGVGMYTDTYGSGKSGDINITTNTLEMRGGAQISASTWAEGQGGSLFINADQVILSGTLEGYIPTIPTGLYSGALGSGNGGNLYITSGSLLLTDRAAIQSYSMGSGHAGNVQVKAGNLQVLNGANILANAYGSGDGGNIVIDSDSVLVSGVHPELFVDTFGLEVPAVSGIASQSFIYGGNAGNVQITAGRLQLLDGGRISTETYGDGNGGAIQITADDVLISGINARMLGWMTAIGADPKLASSAVRTNSNGFFLGNDAKGNGGNLLITARNVQIQNGGLISSKTETSGNGGNIELISDRMNLYNGGMVSAESSGSGYAGNIGIQVSDTLLMKDSSITTEAKYTDGGNIHIKAGHMVELIDSKITTSVGGGPETVGGNITIDPRYVILNDSQIIANAYEGKGGNIRIIADVFLASPDSIVDASSALGIDGTVDIQAPITSISGTLAPVQGNFLSAEALLRDRCAARIRGEKYSSFVVSGRDGLPIRPGSVLPSPIY
jgi:large exoprotein involved in heme utilization and adhesion